MDYKIEALVMPASLRENQKIDNFMLIVIKRKEWSSKELMPGVERGQYYMSVCRKWLKL